MTSDQTFDVAIVGAGVFGACTAYQLSRAGNAVVLVLEVMVVSIQTTRLVLFEFFTRFFIGTGRALHPHAPPVPTGGVSA